MTIIRNLAVAGLAAALAACASTPVKVPVLGDVSALAGEWEGEFFSTDIGRNGTIRFELKAGQDSAYGDVLMTPANWSGRTQETNVMPAPPPLPEPIAISFVQVSQNRVRGTLVPYRDAQCDCTLTTVFNGLLNGDRIEGKFQTSNAYDAVINTGTWYVTRSKPPAPVSLAHRPQSRHR